MNRDDLLYLIEYHNRTNKKILETAALLTVEQLMRPGEFDHDSAFQSLRHMVDVDWSWRLFCEGNDVGKTYVWEIVPLPDLAAVRAFWEKDSAELLVYVQALDNATLEKEITLNFDTPMTARIWQILAHVVNHGTQHRSELARYFTVCGHSPGNMDLI